MSPFFVRVHFFFEIRNTPDLEQHTAHSFFKGKKKKKVKENLKNVFLVCTHRQRN